MTRSIDELLVYHQVNPCILADAPENLPVVIFLGGERLPEVKCFVQENNTMAQP